MITRSEKDNIIEYKFMSPRFTVPLLLEVIHASLLPHTFPVSLHRTNSGKYAPFAVAKGPGCICKNGVSWVMILGTHEEEIFLAECFPNLFVDGLPTSDHSPSPLRAQPRNVGESCCILISSHDPLMNHMRLTNDVESLPEFYCNLGYGH